jgi:hypothetical protein
VQPGPQVLFHRRVRQVATAPAHPQIQIHTTVDTT